MRFSLILLVLALGFAGCARRQAETKFSSLGTGPAGAKPAQVGQDSKLIVTPETVLSGNVIRVNSSARFVVLNFPVGRLPAIEQQLGLYRQGLKVGAVKVTGPQLDDNIVADLVEGQAEVGDQARDR